MSYKQRRLRCLSKVQTKQTTLGVQFLKNTTTNIKENFSKVYGQLLSTEIGDNSRCSVQCLRKNYCQLKLPTERCSVQCLNKVYCQLKLLTQCVQFSAWASSCRWPGPGSQCGRAPPLQTSLISAKFNIGFMSPLQYILDFIQLFYSIITLQIKICWNQFHLVKDFIGI